MNFVELGWLYQVYIAYVSDVLSSNLASSRKMGEVKVVVIDLNVDFVDCMILPNYLSSETRLPILET